MIDVRARNAAIKALLEGDYGRGKVAVRGKRGTSYGWVDVAIDHPSPCPYMRPLIIDRIRDAGIPLGRYEGPFGLDYEIHVSFTG